MLVSVSDVLFDLGQVNIAMCVSVKMTLENGDKEILDIAKSITYPSGRQLSVYLPKQKLLILLLPSQNASRIVTRGEAAIHLWVCSPFKSDAVF